MDDTSIAQSQEAQASQSDAKPEAVSKPSPTALATQARWSKTLRGKLYGAEVVPMERDRYTRRCLAVLRKLESQLKHELSVLDTQEDNATRRALTRCKLSAELRNVLAQKADVLGIARPKPAESAPHGAQTRRRERVLDLQPIGEA